MPDRPVLGSLEQRSAPADRALAVDGRRLRGVIPYGVESRDLGGWREVIDPGALTGARLDDLVANVDHAGVPLARHPGTLEIEDRDFGFAARHQLAVAVERDRDGGVTHHDAKRLGVATGRDHQGGEGMRHSCGVMGA